MTIFWLANAEKLKQMDDLVFTYLNLCFKFFVSFMSYNGPSMFLHVHISPLLHFQLKRQSLGGVIALICKMVINKTKIKFMIDSLINNSLFILIKDKGCLSVCLSGPDTIVGLYVRKAGGLEKCKSYKTVLFG